MTSWCRNCGETIHRDDNGTWVSEMSQGNPAACSEDAALINFANEPKGHIPKK